MSKRKQRKEEKEKVNKISDVKMAYIMYGKKAFIVPIVMVILGAIIWGIVYNARKNNAPQETADNQKEQINYIWGEIKPGKKNANNFTTVTSSDGVQVPVPTGYTASSASDENSVSGGFVIYEGTDAVTESNKWEAQCSRNQYVWIPIAEVSDMYWRDQTTGKKYGTWYNFDKSATTYAKGANRSYEPQTTSWDIQSTYLTQYLNGMSREDFLMEMEIDFDKMLNSVATYGGFYIGRYETGDLSQATPVIKRINTDIADQTWYTMWKKARKLSGTSAGVQMIWGIQWDETMKWLIDTGEKTYAEVGSDSTSWGNYENTSFIYYTDTSRNTTTKLRASRIPSGAYEGANANNVFDLAGNLDDWTLESTDSGTSDFRYLRGGYYFYNGDNAPAADRDNVRPYDSYDGFGLRASLYIK